MERPGSPSQPPGLNCPDHPAFPVRYCCFDVACGPHFLSCVLCVKNRHTACRPKTLVPLSQLGSRVALDIRELDPAGARAEHKYTKAISELLQTAAERTQGALLAFGDRIKTKSVERLGSTAARFSLENWAKLRQEWKVEYQADTKQILLSKNNRVTQEKLSEHCRSLEAYLQSVCGGYLEQLAPPRPYLLREMPGSQWASNGRAIVSEQDEHGVGSLVFEWRAEEGQEDAGLAWCTRPMNGGVFEVTAVWGPATAAPSFQVGLANERHVEKFRTDDPFLLTETLSFGTEGRNASFSDHSAGAFKIPTTSPFRFYVDAESRDTLAIYDSSGSLHLTRKAPLSEFFLFVSLKGPQHTLRIRELA